MLRCSWCLVAGLAIALAGPSAATAGQAPPTGPRTLVLALDGVPLRLITKARAEGAFADWDTPRPLVSTFPSVTNVAYTAMFAPFGIEPAGGYEAQFFDWSENAVVGGRPWGYHDNLFAWRDAFDFTGKSVGGKLSIYTMPASNTWKQFHQAERLLFESDDPLMLVHVGATDALLHLRGDKAVLKVLHEIDERLADLSRRYAESHRGDLRIALLSDHGNTKIKVRSADGVRKVLKRAGLRPRSQLERPCDVVAATFGILNYGVLFTRPENGETAAGAMVEHKTVDLAAWRSGPRRIDVVARSGGSGGKQRGAVQWRDAEDGRRYRYIASDGDPLRLAAVVAAMRAAGLVDDAGFAAERAWLDATVDATYPNAPRRLVDALVGRFVANDATVIFSLEPGFGWGWQSAYVSSMIWGGRLEGTHGGLDRYSSLGFFMSNRELPDLPAVLTVTDVLEPFAASGRRLAP